MDTKVAVTAADSRAVAVNRPGIHDDATIARNSAMSVPTARILPNLTEVSSLNGITPDIRTRKLRRHHSARMAP